jgi:hypothetical protein
LSRGRNVLRGTERIGRKGKGHNGGEEMRPEVRREVMFGGFGGQGIVTAGFITGQAAVLYDNKEATLTQVYGPEARVWWSAKERSAIPTFLTLRLW